MKNINEKDADEKKKLLLGKNKDEMTPKQKLTFDVLMKKLDGGKEHMKFKRMAKTPAQGDDLFHGYVSDLAKKTMKEAVKGEAGFSDAQLQKMKKAYSTFKRIDPSSQNYKKLKTKISELDVDRLEQIARAKIRFVSMIAAGEYAKKSGKRLHARDYMESTELEEAVQINEVQQKEVDALKKLSKDMQAVLKGYQKIVVMGDKELKDTKYNKDYEAVLKSRDTILSLIGKVNFKKAQIELKNMKESLEESVKISFHSKGAKTKWMKKQAVASKEIIKQTPTSVELPSRWKDLSKKKDHDEIFSVVTERKLTDAEMDKREKVAKAIEKDNPDMPMGKKMAIATNVAKGVQMENDAKKKDDKKKDKVKLKDRLDKVTKHEFTPLQKAGLGTALISLGAGTTAQNIVSANENLANEEKEEITEWVPVITTGARLAVTGGRLAMKAAKARSAAAAGKFTKGAASTAQTIKKQGTFGAAQTGLKKLSNVKIPKTANRFTKDGISLGNVASAATAAELVHGGIKNTKLTNQNSKLKSQLAAKNGIRAESADVDEASAYADARRAFKKDDKRGLASLKKDTDDSATESDKKAANKNIIMQLRKAADLPNGAEVIFPSGTKKVDRRTAQQMLLKFNSLKKSFEKDKFQKSIKSLSDVKKILGR